MNSSKDYFAGYYDDSLAFPQADYDADEQDILLPGQAPEPWHPQEELPYRPDVSPSQPQKSSPPVVQVPKVKEPKKKKKTPSKNAEAGEDPSKNAEAGTISLFMNKKKPPTPAKRRRLPQDGGLFDSQKPPCAPRPCVEEGGQGNLTEKQVRRRQQNREAQQRTRDRKKAAAEALAELMEHLTLENKTLKNVKAKYDTKKQEYEHFTGDKWISPELP
jgi:hypothetical protein